MITNAQKMAAFNAKTAKDRFAKNQGESTPVRKSLGQWANILPRHEKDRGHRYLRQELTQLRQSPKWHVRRLPRGHYWDLNFYSSRKRRGEYRQLKHQPMKGRVNRRRIRVWIRTNPNRMGIQHTTYAIGWKHQPIGEVTDKRVIASSRIYFGQRRTSNRPNQRRGMRSQSQPSANQTEEERILERKGMIFGAWIS